MTYSCSEKRRSCGVKYAILDLIDGEELVSGKKNPG